MDDQEMKTLFYNLYADVSRSAATLNVLTNALDTELSTCAKEKLSAETAYSFVNPFWEAFNMVLFELRRIETELETQTNKIP